MRDYKKFDAFTLAEIMVTIFVVAVIALLSFQITKKKADQAVKYTYYAAYNTLAEMTANITSDYNSIKKSTSFLPQSVFDIKDNGLFKKYFALLVRDVELAPTQYEPFVPADPSVPVTPTYNDPVPITPTINDPVIHTISPGIVDDIVISTSSEQTATPTDSTPTGDKLRANAIPTKWADACQMFVDMANVSKSKCNTSTPNGLVKMAPENASIVFPNGMLLYVFGDATSGTPMLIDSAGSSPTAYIVYIDINGSRGNSLIYEDIFPFYVLSDGRVIPGYNPNKQAGGNSREYLAVSVRYDTYPTSGTNAGKRVQNHMDFNGQKETSFMEAACSAGYVNDTTKYCGTIKKRSVCTADADCTISVIKPFKFF